MDKAAYAAIETLCIYEREIDVGAEYTAGKMLYRLACVLRKLGKRRAGDLVADRAFEAADPVPAE